MSRKIVYAIIPVCLLLLFMAVYPANAQDESRNMSMPVVLEDANPTLSKAVKYELGRVEALNTPDIQVASAEGTVTLIGRVGSAALREQAEDIARDVPGVSRVINELWVRDLMRDTAFPALGQ